MAKVVLISCNVVDDPYPVYPLGMSMIAEAARLDGHEVEQIDFMMNDKSFEKLSDKVKEFSPEFIGISIRNIDNTDSVTPVSFVEIYAELVSKLREVSDASIILGGAGYSLFPDVMLKKTGADYGIAGEGEKTFCGLLKHLTSGSKPENRVLYSESSMPGADIPVCGRESDIAAYYLHEGGMLNVQTKRGCPHRCIYCSYPLIEGRVYRFRPASSIVDEIENLIKKYNADYYSITDSVFNDSQGKYLEIAEELVRRNISVPWMAFFKPQDYSDEEVALLRKAGLKSVEWGTDASTDKTLAIMRKGFTWADTVKSSEMFCKHGIANSHFIIFGVPGETEETVIEGLRNIEQLQNSVVFVYTGIRILPGTEIREIAIRENIISPDDDLLEPRFYISKEVSFDFIHNAILESFKGRIDRVYPPGKDLDKIKAFHRMGYRGPIWDMLLLKNRERKRN